jgi:hypothetical protein
MVDAHRPTLDYANPTAFFDGAYRYRSLSGVVGALVTGGFAVALLFAWRMLPAVGIVQNRVMWFLGGLLLLLAAAMVAGCVWLVVGMVRGTEQRVRVTDHGISQGKRLWPWVRIARFGGVRHLGGVAITFQLRGRGHAVRTLVTTPTLTAEQFVNLARTVKAFAGETYPHVLVVEEPESGSSD